MARGEVRIATRALEAYWSGFATWFLARTDSVAWRHREEAAHMRGCVLAVGEALVRMRVTGPTNPQRCESLEQLQWHAEVARTRRLLSVGDLDRVRKAIETVRGMLNIRSPALPPPNAAMYDEPTH